MESKVEIIKLRGPFRKIKIDGQEIKGVKKFSLSRDVDVNDTNLILTLKIAIDEKNSTIAL